MAMLIEKKNPAYHISIGWADMSCDLSTEFCGNLQAQLEPELESINIRATELKLKIGNEISTFGFDDY